MLNIGRILHQDRLLRATTGLNRRAFETLLEKFEQVYLAEADNREKPRKRKIGAGRKARLQSIKEKLLDISKNSVTARKTGRLDQESKLALKTD
jgi:hypothetical protein